MDVDYSKIELIPKEVKEQIIKSTLLSCRDALLLSIIYNPKCETWILSAVKEVINNALTAVAREKSIENFDIGFNTIQ